MYLSIRMQRATSVYANRVPMDIISTKASRSNRRAMIAEDIKVWVTSSLLTEAWYLSNSFCTCHSSRYDGRYSRTTLSSDFSQRVEQQSISCHGKQNSRHREHGTQKTGRTRANTVCISLFVIY